MSFEFGTTANISAHTKNFTYNTVITYPVTLRDLCFLNAGLMDGRFWEGDGGGVEDRCRKSAGDLRSSC